MTGFRGVIYLELRALAVIAVYVVVLVSIGFIQSLLLPLISYSMSSSSITLLALSISTINLMAALILSLSSHVLFNVLTPLHATRCSIVYTLDCKLTKIMSSHKLLASAILLPVFLVALITGSMVRLGLPVTPVSILNAILYGLVNVYGVLELSGYTLAYMTPILGRRMLALIAVILITLGAIVEANLILNHS